MGWETAGNVFPPKWASAWGIDRLSPYAYASIKLSSQVYMRLRWIPAGKFLMGSPKDENGRSSDEGPQHSVTLSSGFWLAEAPCTQEQWQAVMGGNPSNFQENGRNRPVEQVSWDECLRYCMKLRELIPGFDAVLPTEAQWEYACRAGTQSAFNDGSPCTEPSGSDSALADLGWFHQNSESKTHPVKAKGANNWGLYDMHGNVYEWCADWYGEYAATEQLDHVGPSEGRGRVLRGGGWDDHAGNCRSAGRSRRLPGGRRSYLGFRLAAVQPG